MNWAPQGPSACLQYCNQPMNSEVAAVTYALHQEACFTIPLLHEAAEREL